MDFPTRQFFFPKETATDHCKKSNLCYCRYDQPYSLTYLVKHYADDKGAAFCMYNRYVDGLATWAPSDRQFYVNRAPHRAEEGYIDFDLYK